MEKITKKQYAIVVTLIICMVLTLVDIIYSIVEPKRYLTLGFIAILFAIEIPKIRKYMLIEYYHSMYLSVLLLSIFISIYFIMNKNILNAVIIGLVGLLITVRKNQDIK